METWREPCSNWYHLNIAWRPGHLSSIWHAWTAMESLWLLKWIYGGHHIMNYLTQWTSQRCKNFKNNSTISTSGKKMRENHFSIAICFTQNYFPENVYLLTDWHTITCYIFLFFLIIRFRIIPILYINFALK